MPYLYVAKVNLNSSIFDVYENKLNIQTVMETIYENINNDMSYEKVENSKYTDSLGNEHRYEKKSKYVLFNVIKLV